VKPGRITVEEERRDLVLEVVLILDGILPISFKVEDVEREWEFVELFVGAMLCVDCLEVLFIVVRLVELDSTLSQPAALTINTVKHIHFQELMAPCMTKPSKRSVLILTMRT